MPVWCAYFGFVHMCIYVRDSDRQFLECLHLSLSEEGEFVKRLSLYGMWILPALV